MTVQKDPQHREIRHLNKLATFAGKRILEIGIGEGRLAWSYASGADRVMGIDLDRDALRVARVDRPASLQTLNGLLQARAEELPLRGESFDLALFAWSF